MSTVSRRRAQIGFTVLTLCMSACNAWPPEQDELSDYFWERREHLNELAKSFEGSPFLSIDHGGINADVYASAEYGAQRTQLRGEDGKTYRELLENAGAFRVFRDNTKIVITPYFNNLQSGKIVTANFI